MTAEFKKFLRRDGPTTTTRPTPRRPEAGWRCVSTVGSGLSPRLLHATGKNQARHLCGDLNVAPTELDLAKPRSNRRQAGFKPTKIARDSRLSGMRVFVVTFSRFHGQGNGPLLVVGVISPTRGALNSGGESTTFSFAGRCANAVKSAEIHPRHRQSDQFPVSITLEA